MNQPDDPQLQVVAPFWLDRPDLEVVEIATNAANLGYGGMWLGEMATFDAFALATAVGLRAPGLDLTVGPLAVGVRSPVALALGLSSVAQLTGAQVDLALGASSPAIVAGWHDRDWARPAERMSEMLDSLRPILDGQRSAFEGRLIKTAGFRLRHSLPEARISVAAFGPLMTRVAAAQGDAVVLNLVEPETVKRSHQAVGAEAAKVGRPAPPLAAWIPVALEPGAATLEQLAAQIAVYLAPPGYGEMFTSLGFGDLVQRARGGERRASLAADVPRELLEQVCALGSAKEIRDRLSSYRAAGVERLAIVPATAEDPGGARVLAALSPSRDADGAPQ